MMSGTSFAVAIAAIVVCASALPAREQDIDLLSKIGSNHISGDRFDANGHKVRNLDPLGGGNLLREVRESRNPEFIPLLTARRIEYGRGYRRNNPMYFPDDFTRMVVEAPKRNFDEIDRTSFDRFIKKRNFDEIDHSSFGSFSKRNDDAYPIAIRLYEDKR